MIVILKSDASQQQVDDVVRRIEELGFRAHLSQGTHRTIVGIIGDEQKLRAQPLKAIPAVEQVVPVMRPYKLASLDAHAQPSVVEVGGVKVGFGGAGFDGDGVCLFPGHGRRQKPIDSIKVVVEQMNKSCF